MGYAVSASAIAGVMNGCKADPEAVSSGLDNWAPGYLSKEEGKLVAQIAECILPKTDTPGAIDAGVHSFIDVFLNDNAAAEEQKGFSDGLAAFGESCKNAHEKSFVACTQEQQIELLKKEEADAWKQLEADPEAQTFWFGIKELTMLGYFTSEVGAKEFLKHLPIPGEYKACIPYEEVGGTWAL